MLPIDSLTDTTKDILRSHGEDPDRLFAVLHLDGGKGKREIYLALTTADTALLRILPDAGTVEKTPISEYTQPYVDSMLSTCRLLAVHTPPGGEAGTVLLGECGGACRDRLFIFLAVPFTPI